MRRAVYPGSFDPFTNGHLDILGRATKLFDWVTLALGANPSKRGLFGVDERAGMLRAVAADYSNVDVAMFDGLLVDFCRSNGIAAIVKGLRVVGDFEYELQMAQMNLRLSGVETILMPTRPEYSYLSSSLVKEVAGLGGDVSGLVPEDVLHRLTRALAP